MILVVSLVILVIPVTSGNSSDMKTMTKISDSYEDYAISGERWPGQDRITLGSALLAVFGLSLLGWAAVLAPLVAIFHK